MTWKTFNLYSCLGPLQVESLFFLTILWSSPRDVQGSSLVPYASSSFGVESVVLNIDAAAKNVADAATVLESVICADKSTVSTLSRYIVGEVSGCSNSLRLVRRRDCPGAVVWTILLVLLVIALLELVLEIQLHIPLVLRCFPRLSLHLTFNLQVEAIFACFCST